MSNDAKKTCATCAWVHRFTPRPDEVERGLTMGCKKPGWEGYTRENEPACGGVFYFAATEPAHKQVSP